MNTVVGSSGLTFSSIVNTIDNSVYQIIATGGTFFFDLNSDMYKYGTFLINLNSSQTLTSSKVIGPIKLYYTRYIDVVCPELLMYDKNPSNGTDNYFKNNNIMRLYLYFDSLNIGGPFNTFYQLSPGNAWKNFNRTQSISTLTLEFYDEYGRYLYIPSYGNNTLTSFWCQFIILTEL